jgi:hypothetical protein
MINICALGGIRRHDPSNQAVKTHKLNRAVTGTRLIKENRAYLFNGKPRYVCLWNKAVINFELISFSVQYLVQRDEASLRQLLTHNNCHIFDHF